MTPAIAAIICISLVVFVPFIVIGLFILVEG